MKTKLIAIGLAANRIDILVCHGDRVSASKRVAVPFDVEPEKWLETLTDAVKSTSSAVKELGIRGASAVVFYHSPTEIADYAVLQFKSANEAKQAAILGCADSLSCAIDQTVSNAHVLARDLTSGKPQTHLVVAADRDESVNAISTFVEACGLRFRGALPIDALTMTRVARHALKHAKEPTGYLYIGERRSAFVIAGKGALMFARPISLGVDALITSLTRPIRNVAGGEPIQLNTETARNILFQHGFAKRNQVVHETLGLVAGQLLPSLQPVVQRFIIELRQSIRFGLPEGRKQSVNLVLMGPGSTIPGFNGIIAEEIQVGVMQDESSAKYRPNAPDSPGSELLDAVQSRRIYGRLLLQPQFVLRAKQGSRIKRCMWIGAAAALGLVALDASRFHFKIQEEKAELNRQIASAADARGLQETAAKLKEQFAAIDGLDAIISKETGAQVNLRACLHEFGILTPPSIRLTNITLAQIDGKTVGSIAGYAFEDKNVPGRSALEPFINHLRRSPLFDQVLLANVQLSTLGELNGQRFEASFSGVAAPREQKLASTESGVEGATP